MNLLVSCKILDLRGLTIFKLKCEALLRLQSRYLTVEKDCISVSSLFLSPMYWCHPRISHIFFLAGCCHLILPELEKPWLKTKRKRTGWFISFLQPASPLQLCALLPSAVSAATRSSAPAGGPAFPPAHLSQSSSDSPAFVCDAENSSCSVGWSALFPPGPPLQWLTKGTFIQHTSEMWGDKLLFMNLTHVLLVACAVWSRFPLLFHETLGLLQHLLHLD